MRPLLLAILIGAAHAQAAVDARSATVLTELVTTALSHEPRLQVVSSADLRRQLEAEAERQTVGCDAESASCLAEIAGAMGAQLVVHGNIGVLAGTQGDVVILTLNVFDSSQGRAVGRIALQDVSLAGLSTKVERGVQQLVAPLLHSLGEGKAARLLVMDIRPPQRNAAVVDEAPSSGLFGWSSLAGGGVGLLGGVVLLVVAAEADRSADNPDLDAIEANDAYDRRDWLLISSAIAGAIGAAALTVGGIVVAVSD